MTRNFFTYGLLLILLLSFSFGIATKNPKIITIENHEKYIHERYIPLQIPTTNITPALNVTPESFYRPEPIVNLTSPGFVFKKHANILNYSDTPESVNVLYKGGKVHAYLLTSSSEKYYIYYGNSSDEDKSILYLQKKIVISPTIKNPIPVGLATPLNSLDLSLIFLYNETHFQVYVANFSEGNVAELITDRGELSTINAGDDIVAFSSFYSYYNETSDCLISDCIVFVYNATEGKLYNQSLALQGVEESEISSVIGNNIFFVFVKTLTGVHLYAVKVDGSITVSEVPLGDLNYDLKNIEQFYIDAYSNSSHYFILLSGIIDRISRHFLIVLNSDLTLVSSYEIVLQDDSFSKLLYASEDEIRLITIITKEPMYYAEALRLLKNGTFYVIANYTIFEASNLKAYSIFTTRPIIGAIYNSSVGYYTGQVDSDFDLLPDTEETQTNPKAYDTDFDGIPDGSEVLYYKTNPANNDTDFDGIPDGIEISKYGTSPLLKDTDSDGLSDYEEIEKYKTNPFSKDTDLDGLSDYDEVVKGVKYQIGREFEEKIAFTNPLAYDTDGDGLSDGREATLRTNPASPDTDSDNLTDTTEIEILGTLPWLNDTDRDGLTDWQEVSVYVTNPIIRDTDGDYLIDGDEIKLGCDPKNPDTDGDGLVDGMEVILGTNPLSSDTDGDGISDYMEIKVGTNPRSADTDGDFLPDKYDLLPTTNNFLVLLPIVIVIGFGAAYIYGLFRNIKNDIIAIGLTDTGGTPITIIPEEFAKVRDPNLVSPAFIGIYNLITEVSKIEGMLILGRKPAIIINKTENSYLWVIAKEVYPKLLNRVKNVHKIVEEKYGTSIKEWLGFEDELDKIKGDIKTLFQLS